MLLREDDRGVLAIGQPSHSWLSGQLARAWGNDQFARPHPFEEVCLAAEQHDVGWRIRDLEPSYNPETQLPRSFMEMPLDFSLELWTTGPRALLSQSRYAALLASMHGGRLFERRDLAKMSPEDAEAVTSFLAEQRSFQAELMAALRADPAGSPLAGAELVQRNSLLIWTVDYLSLALCLDWAPVTAKRAPTASGTVDLELTLGGEPRLLHLEPWPFAEPSLVVHCEGRRLAERFADEREMRRAFAGADWETLELRLERR
jgi:hypothetical protein